MPATIYTIGHSIHKVETFLALLEQHSIGVVADVRSAPFSRRHPQFSRGNLTASLAGAGIEYQFFGKELGARSEDASCYEGGKVQYERLAETDLFRQGIARLLELASGSQRVALLCAEKEPLQCHRTILVSRRLARLGVAVAHILATGELESHAAAMLRLVELLKLPAVDLFRTEADVIEEAYRLQGQRIAYAREETQNVIIGP